MQSLLIMFGILLVIPLVRAVIGLALISLSAALGLQQSHVRAAGVSLLPAFLRTALGFATVVAMVQPQMASAADPTPIVIDRVVEIPSASPSATPPVSPSAQSAPTKAPTASPARTSEKKPRVIVFDDDFGDSVTEESSNTSPDDYVVQVGDSLWTIARSVIDDPQPSARSIDRAWRTLWEANRAVIGPDPSLIRPGTVLKLNRDDILNNIR
jgi:LysM repeat protein